MPATDADVLATFGGVNPAAVDEIVQARKARSTGTLVLVVDNRNHCLDDDPSVPWFTICSDHGGCVGHPTRKIATDWAAAPEEWCPTCRGDEPEYLIR